VGILSISTQPYIQRMMLSPATVNNSGQGKQNELINCTSGEGWMSFVLSCAYSCVMVYCLQISTLKLPQQGSSLSVAVSMKQLVFKTDWHGAGSFLNMCILTNMLLMEGATCRPYQSGDLRAVGDQLSASRGLPSNQACAGCVAETAPSTGLLHKAIQPAQGLLGLGSGPICKDSSCRQTPDSEHNRTSPNSDMIGSHALQAAQVSRCF
jgi:hypothetical protein